MDKYGLKSVGDFHKIEDARYSPTLSKEIMRKALVTGLEQLSRY